MERLLFFIMVGVFTAIALPIALIEIFKAFRKYWSRPTVVMVSVIILTIIIVIASQFVHPYS